MKFNSFIACTTKRVATIAAVVLLGLSPSFGESAKQAVQPEISANSLVKRAVQKELDDNGSGVRMMYRLRKQTPERTETREYDFYTGLATQVTDVDNNVSTATSYDVFGRPTLVRAAKDKPEETRARTEYDDTLRRVIVRSDLNAVGDEKLVTIQHYDQLGRIRLARATGRCNCAARRGDK